MSEELKVKFEEILSNMVDIAPHKIHEHLKPYIIEAMDEAYKLKSDEWVSVEAALPEAKEKVLAINNFKFMRQADWEYGCDQNKQWFKNTFTHWQPLPKPPTHEPTKN